MNSTFKNVMAVALLICSGPLAVAAEITVLAANNSLPAMREIGPLFEKASGHKASIEFGLNPALKQRVEAGERFDVVLLEPEMLEELASSRKIAAGSVISVAQIGMGLLVRAGTPRAEVRNTK